MDGGGGRDSADIIQKDVSMKTTQVCEFFWSCDLWYFEP